jgi:hypothetical protein
MPDTAGGISPVLDTCATGRWSKFPAQQADG